MIDPIAQEQIEQAVRDVLEQINVRPDPIVDEVETGLQMFVAKTPGGGIAAASGDTPGSASCTLGYIDDNGDLQTTVHTETVYNMATGGSIAGSTWITAHQEAGSGKYIAVWEDC